MKQEELDTWRSDPTTVEIFNIMKEEAERKEEELKSSWFNDPTTDISGDVMYLKNYTAILYNLTTPSADDYNAGEGL